MVQDRVLSHVAFLHVRCVSPHDPFRHQKVVPGSVWLAMSFNPKEFPELRYVFLIMTDLHLRPE